MYVSDFGLARVKSAEQSSGVTMQNFGPIGVSIHIFTLVVVGLLMLLLKWMAPEALTKREYSEATDAFSFGVFLW